jgi:glutathione synthase/RimK-type ligase-like ATP-grasp enzyme
VPKKLVLVPVNLGSKGAKALADVLSEKVGHKVFRVTPDAVRNRVAFRLRPGTDKLQQFNKFKENNVSCPEHTTSIDDARRWVVDGPVVCRTLLRASEGRGIVVAETADQLVPAPLYTRYVKKKKEFRVHVLNGEVIDVQEKRKRKEVPDDFQRDTRVRNLANGYVFCRDSVHRVPALDDLAITACRALGYNLGAVDVAWNERANQYYVLEVNAAPGMQGSTLVTYADKIAAWYKQQEGFKNI